MTAKHVPVYNVNCQECKWNPGSYETAELAESAVKLHNQDQHPNMGLIAKALQFYAEHPEYRTQDELIAGEIERAAKLARDMGIEP